MCLLITKEASQPPDWDAYEAGFLSNPDGAGFAVAFGGEVITSKAYWDFDKFKSAIEVFSDKPIMIHFRITTHGTSDVHNCHPFDVGVECPLSGPEGQIVMGHNGILSSFYDPVEPTTSDTRQFIRKVVSPLRAQADDFYRKDWVIQSLESVTTGSRLAFMDYEGTFTYLHKAQGNTDKGHWYSNYSRLDYYGRGYTSVITEKANPYPCRRGRYIAQEDLASFPDYQQWLKDEADEIDVELMKLGYRPRTAHNIMATSGIMYLYEFLERAQNTKDRKYQECLDLH